MEITKKFLEAKGLSNKEIKEYLKNLKNLRKAINPDLNLESSVEKYFELNGGLRFFYQEWYQGGSKNPIPRSIVFVLHAAYGSSDLFYPIADYLKTRGIMVVGIDYRGHGRTGGQAGGKLGDFHEFKDIYSDVITLVEHYQVKFNVPIFLLGYDIGGLIAVQIANLIKEPILEGLILISPIWELEQKWKHIFLYPFLSLGKMISKSENHQKVLEEKLETTYFEEYKQFAKNDPLRLKRMSYRMFKSLLDLIRKTHHLRGKINLPCIFFQGTEDFMVDHYAVHKLYEKWGHPTKKIRLYENIGHNILVDIYAVETQNEILDFINNLVDK